MRFVVRCALMGIYWTLVCDDAKEFVEPHALKGQGAKAGEVMHPDSKFGQLALYCMIERWQGMGKGLNWCRARMVPEFEMYDYEERGYKDVSIEAIREFNKYWSDRPEYHIEPDLQYALDLADSHCFDEKCGSPCNCSCSGCVAMRVTPEFET